ncbi:transporter [Mucilaginibacter aquaedulcis]|uniref:transporter n=1 Tax=Mucilaginibacter aquaedulcis TaxID=1187081 RepID=UPI0025B4BB6C|nr:transporter [Mucilaginibacter aquaedulcis]MDN3551548.1 transporter [Mucilaginibacter aquaedulcis]
MVNTIPIFKSWVPGWAIKIILFSLILPTLVLFFLPLTNINAAAGYYGCEPSDIQFTIALFYSGYLAFYSLERRFFNFLATKEYFVMFTILEILTTLVCYKTNDIYILFPTRFIQGILFSSTVNLSLSLMFTRLHSERAREISFSIFFGMLICVVPFNNLVTANLIDSYNFNIVYKGALFSYLPCLCFIMASMNNVRLNVKFPLYKLDWQSFVLWSIILTLMGYITIYGQEYYWLADNRILYSVAAIAVCTIIYIIRQGSLKRPYLHLGIFSSRNFKFGILLLLIYYVCRFSGNVTNVFFAGVLKLDPIHISYVNSFNLGGLTLGVIISCSMILQKKNIRFIWLPGFLLLLAFHVSMFFIFDTEANENNYYLPLFIQGLGVGMVLVPTIVYAISSVPLNMGPSATAICSTAGYTGFCLSAATINYYELYEKSRHYNAFQDHLTKVDKFTVQALSGNTSHLVARGLSLKQSAKGANKQLVLALNRQLQLRFAMDYYEIMSILLIITILLIAIFPYLNKTIVRLRSRGLAPA